MRGWQAGARLPGGRLIIQADGKTIVLALTVMLPRPQDSPHPHPCRLGSQTLRDLNLGSSTGRRLEGQVRVQRALRGR